MRAWIFTFGSNHVHPETGESLASCFIRIPALDAEDARREMVRRFGLKWAFQYDTEDQAGVERYRLREIEPPPPRPLPRSALANFALNLPPEDAA